MTAPSPWFCTLLDAAPEVFFRYELAPVHRLAYVSRSVEALAGVSVEALQADAALCRAVVAPGDRRALVRMRRVRRRSVTRVHLVRDGMLVPVEIEAVPVWQTRRIVAVEGCVRLAAPGVAGAPERRVPDEPVQQRLASLMVEVHDLLHRVLPPDARQGGPSASPRVLRVGEMALDCDSLVASEGGVPVALTSREVLLLRYLLDRRGRIVTRQQLLTDVWGYRYVGDDRTVDVHVSRLRRKLPSLRGRLVALRQVGYRLDDEASPTRAA